MNTPFGIHPSALAECKRFDADVYSDLYKEVYGSRPRMSLGHLSGAELDAEWDMLCDRHEVMMENDRLMYLANQKNLEIKISDTVKLGAKTRARALRWIFQGWEIEEDLERYGANYLSYFCSIPTQIAQMYVEEAEA